MTIILRASNTSLKPHLSPTQLEMYCRCPEQYRRRYVEKEIIPPGMPILKGRGVHGGIEVNGRQKIETHQDLPAADIQEAAAAAFDLGVSDGYALTEEEHGRGAGVVLAEAKDAAVEMARFYAERQAPDYQPVMVERSVRIELPMASHDLMGIIDLADDRDRVTDFKTSARRKSQADADSSVQLTTYAVAHLALTGRPAKEVRLDTVVRLKSKTERDLQVSTRGAVDFAALAHRINAVTAAIGAGIFPPTTPGNWACDPKWCGYWNSCKYVNSERKAAADARE